MEKFEITRNGNPTGEFLSIEMTADEAKKFSGSTVTLVHASTPSIPDPESAPVATEAPAPVEEATEVVEPTQTEEPEARAEEMASEDESDTSSPPEEE